MWNFPDIQLLCNWEKTVQVVLPGTVPATMLMCVSPWDNPPTHLQRWNTMVQAQKASPGPQGGPKLSVCCWNGGYYYYKLFLSFFHCIEVSTLWLFKIIYTYTHTHIYIYIGYHIYRFHFCVVSNISQATCICTHAHTHTHARTQMGNDWDPLFYEKIFHIKNMPM